MMTNAVYTIGHSTHSIEKLIEVHRATHPSRLERVKSVGDANPQALSDDVATALLEVLADDEDEEA